MKRLMCLAGLLLVVGCAASTQPLASALRVSSNAAAVQLTNESGRATFYFICERGAAATIDWRPCVDSPACASVAPGKQVVIADAAIAGFAPGKSEAIVWWWQAVPTSTRGLVPGEVHSVVVSL